MSQLEELKRQRQELDAKIKELENTEIVCGKVKYDRKSISIKYTRYLANREEEVQWRKVLFFPGEENAKGAKEYLDSLISDLRELSDKI